MQEVILPGGATSDECFRFGPNKYHNQRHIDARRVMLSSFGLGIVFVIFGLSGSNLVYTLAMGLLSIATGGVLYKLIQCSPMMIIDAEGFTVDMIQPKGLCVCCTGMIPPSKFTWDQVESVRVVAFQDDVYEGTTVNTTFETTTTTQHYNRQEVSMLAVSFKSPKPDDLLLSTMARKPCGHMGALRNLEDYDVDVVISGLSPLFAPDDDEHVYEFQARDTEYVLECFQKFLPDITLPPLYGLKRTQGNKLVLKWGLLSEYNRIRELPDGPGKNEAWKSYGN